MTPYRIFVTISHQAIAFEYCPADGLKGLLPFDEREWPVPLAFYCNPGGGITIGEEAVRAAQGANPQAFVNLFDLLPTGLTFEYAHDTVPITKLLLFASEQQFKRFFQNVLFNRYGSLEENRRDLHLVLATEADITPNEEEYLRSLFADSGYAAVQTIPYQEAINRYFEQIYPGKTVVIAWSDGQDLNLSVQAPGRRLPKPTASFPGLGKDPRLPKITDMLWEQIANQAFMPDRAQNEKRLNDIAADFLASGMLEDEDWLTLADGTPCSYMLNRSEINRLQLPESTQTSGALRSLLRENGLEDRSQSVLVLREHAAGNDYFRNQLASGFGQVDQVTPEIRAEVKRILATLQPISH